LDGILSDLVWILPIALAGLALGLLFSRFMAGRGVKTTLSRLRENAGFALDPDAESGTHLLSTRGTPARLVVEPSGHARFEFPIHGLFPEGAHLETHAATVDTGGVRVLALDGPSSFWEQVAPETLRKQLGGLARHWTFSQTADLLTVRTDSETLLADYDQVRYALDRVSTLLEAARVASGAQWPQSRFSAGDDEGLPPGVAVALAEPLTAKQSMAQGILVLLVSVLAFAGISRARGGSTADVALVIGVLLFHELGHFAAMKAAGYRDLRIFFIPFFGAATSGTPTKVSQTQQAIVLLAGPLPGLMVAFALLLSLGPGSSLVVVHAAMYLLVINGFNLLPMVPLDGGRLLAVLVFSRHPFVEVVFLLLAVVGLATLALWTLSPIVGLLAGGVFVATSTTWATAKACRALAGSEVARLADGSQNIPVEARIVVANHVQEHFGKLQTRPMDPKLMVRRMRDVWQRVGTQPASRVATTVLLGVYLAAVAAAFGVLTHFYQMGKNMGGAG